MFLTGLAPNDTRLTAHTLVFAAQELRHYLLRLTGAAASAFPIQPRGGGLASTAGIELVVLGATSPPDLQSWKPRLIDPGSFALVPDGRRLVIVAGDRIGVLYGVYAFLERQGVRWYAPGEPGEVVPSKVLIQFPAAPIWERPAMATRGFFAWEGRGGREFLIWMARNRLNYWTVAEADHFLLDKLGIGMSAGSHWVWPDYLNPSDPYPFRPAGAPEDPHKPVDPYPPSPESHGDLNADGTLSYFEAHPEWYGLLDGKRTAFNDIFGVNVCSSNPHVMTELNRRLVADLRSGRWRDVEFLDFWAIDNGKWCECDSCRRLGSPTDRLLRMVHQVNQALDRAREAALLSRDIKVFFPIYLDTLQAPTRPLPDGFDYARTFGTFFPIRRCYLHALNDPACAETNAPIWQTISNWRAGAAHYRGRFVMGEYYNVSTTKNLPVLYTRTMGPDIQAYQHLGVAHMHYMHAPTRLLGPKRLTNYLFARLLWNPQTDVPALLGEYFPRFYGNRSQTMRIFYNRLEDAMAPIHQWKADREGLARRLVRNQRPLFAFKHHAEKASEGALTSFEASLAALRDCRKIIDEALSRPGGQTLRERLAEDERNLRYAEHTLALYDGLIRTLAQWDRGDRAAARKAYQTTFPAAAALKLETTLLQSGASHSNATDGLEAAQVEDLWLELGRKLASTGATVP
jgi:hypothetical protein